MQKGSKSGGGHRAHRIVLQRSRPRRGEKEGSKGLPGQNFSKCLLSLLPRHGVHRDFESTLHPSICGPSLVSAFTSHVVSRANVFLFGAHASQPHCVCIAIGSSIPVKQYRSPRLPVRSRLFAWQYCMLNGTMQQCSMVNLNAVGVAASSCAES